MITEQALLDFMRETAYKPMTYNELEEHLELADAESFKALLKLLNQLEERGEILRTRTNRYGVPERMNLLRGRVQAHAKGFAFLIPDDKGHPDVYLHANDLKTAMNGDIVLVRVTSKSASGGRLEGEVARVVQRAVTQVVGTFENHEAYGFIVPDDKRINRDIFIPKGGYMGAVTGQKVVARIVSYPEGRSAAEGEIVEVLGHKDDPGVDILSIIRKHQLPESFPVDVLAEAEAAPDAITEEEIQRQGRRDLRDQVIVTIDGADAKDLDDAVHVERLENGNYVLGVHIADVSYYVTDKSALDQEAYRRGCSVYLVDRVIPMLPHRLSNGICSLNPQVDRLTMSCEMEFEAKTLKRVRHDIFTSVIRTKERMTYADVRAILVDKDEALTARYAELVDMFRQMEELAMKLRKQRMKRGAIDFDFQESKILVDENGKPTDIVKRERSVAEQIIEEFMLAANETVAEHFHWLRVPFLYRIHEDPDAEKLMHFVQFASNLGYAVKGKSNSIHPRALQALLEQIRGEKEETVISTMMLRSMKQAKYDAQSLGHFGLAAEFYSHFTSPIRRYPDLVIHRVIREVLESGGTLPQARHEALEARMPDIAQQSSERERLAVEAERDTDKLKKAEFMLDKVGEEFEGLISGVTSFGMFVELDNTVEGLIRLSDLTDDYYHFHELHMALIGERTSKIYRIGDEVKIRVARVNMDDYAIDFELVDMKARKARAGQDGFGRGAGAFGGGATGFGAGRGGKGGKAGKAGRGGKAGPGGYDGQAGGKAGKAGGKTRKAGPGENAGGKARKAGENAGGKARKAGPGENAEQGAKPWQAGGQPAAEGKRGRKDMWGLPISGGQAEGGRDDGAAAGGDAAAQGDRGRGRPRNSSGGSRKGASGGSSSRRRAAAGAGALRSEAAAEPGSGGAVGLPGPSGAGGPGAGFAASAGRGASGKKRKKSGGMAAFVRKKKR